MTLVWQSTLYGPCLLLSKRLIHTHNIQSEKETLKEKMLGLLEEKKRKLREDLDAFDLTLGTIVGSGIERKLT